MTRVRGVMLVCAFLCVCFACTQNFSVWEFVMGKYTQKIIAFANINISHWLDAILNNAIDDAQKGVCIVCCALMGYVGRCIYVGFECCQHSLGFTQKITVLGNSKPITFELLVRLSTEMECLIKSRCHHNHISFVSIHDTIKRKNNEF